MKNENTIIYVATNKIESGILRADFNEKAIKSNTSLDEYYSARHLGFEINPLVIKPSSVFFSAMKKLNAIDIAVMMKYYGLKK